MGLHDFDDQPTLRSLRSKAVTSSRAEAVPLSEHAAPETIRSGPPADSEAPWSLRMPSLDCEAESGANDAPRPGYAVPRSGIAPARYAGEHLEPSAAGPLAPEAQRTPAIPPAPRAPTVDAVTPPSLSAPSSPLLLVPGAEDAAPATTRVPMAPTGMSRVDGLELQIARLQRRVLVLSLLAIGSAIISLTLVLLRLLGS